MTDTPPSFVYDGSPDALIKIEHLFGRRRMRMVEKPTSVTQFNRRTLMTETATLPKPDPLTLDVDVDVEHTGRWVHVPLGAVIEHDRRGPVRMVVDLGIPERTLD